MNKVDFDNNTLELLNGSSTYKFPRDPTEKRLANELKNSPRKLDFNNNQ